MNPDEPHDLSQPIFQQGEIHERRLFGDLLNARLLHGDGVEIGVFRGEFASEVLSRWTCRRFYCIDPYVRGYDPMDPASAADMGEAERVAWERLSKFPNVCFLKTSSAEVVGRFQDGSLDFVYVDGNHQFKQVLHDLRVWWPKLRPGGVLAGHDFVCPGENAGGWGRFVQPAVLLHAKAQRVIIYLVPESGGMPWSFYMVRL